MMSSIDDNQKLGEKIPTNDKKKIKDALIDTQDWLNANQEAEKDDIEEKLKDLQRVCDPIISSVY
jgi:heat shock protein 5